MREQSAAAMVIVIVFLSLLALAVWTEIFKFRACITAGHSPAYCRLEVGEW